MSRRLDAAGAGPATWLVPAGLLAVAAAWAELVLFRTDPARVRLSADLYWADYPNVVYALRALREGHGLLWNRLQNCGQPFLASTLVGLFYPPHWLVVVLGPEHGMRAITVLHLAIAGWGTFALARVLELDAVPAACAALAFELGGAAVHFASWLPWSLLGAYAWMPVAAWRTERLLRTPTTRNAIALGVVLTLPLTIGYPQLLLFTVQLVVLRALWECVRPGMPRLRIAGALALGLVLPAALGAAQLLPMLEFARESVRNRALGWSELGLLGVPTWKTYLQRRMFSGLGWLFTVTGTLLAGVGVVRPRRRGTALFFALVGAVYLALAFDTPLLALSRRLPFGRSFRWPQHALAVTGLAWALLAGIGIDTLLARPAAGRGARLLPVVGLVLGGVAIAVLVPHGFRPMERWELAACVALVVWLGATGAGRRLAGIALAALVLVSTWRAASEPFMAPGGRFDLLFARRALFADVARRMTAGDRVYLVGRPGDYGLEPKSASVFGIPAITDYEPQTSERYAELVVMMLGGTPMTSLAQFEIHPDGELPRRRPLLDLLAARYVVLDLRAAGLDSAAGLTARVGPDFALLHEADGVAVWENRRALPRASFVPATRVVTPPARLLAELAADDADARPTALVETAVAGAADADAHGTVEIVADRSEEVVLRARTTGQGWVLLVDQDYPGWEATVDGKPAPIVRADYAFRLVAVPAGESTVVFRYRPASVRRGLAVSAATLAALAAWAVRRMLTARSRRCSS